MISRLFLAAGVAALAVTAPASAKPGNGGGHGGPPAARSGGGGGHGQGGGAAQFRGGGGGGGHAVQMQSFQRHGGGGGGHAFQMQSFQRHGGGGFAAPRMQRQSFAAQNRGHGSAMRVERANNRAMRSTFSAQRGHQHQNVQRFEQRQARNFERQQLRGNRMAQMQNREARHFDRQQLRGNRFEQVQNRQAMRDLRSNRFAQAQNREALRNELRANRIAQLDNGMLVREGRLGNRALNADEFRANALGYGIGGCPPGLASKGCMPPGQAAKLLGTRLSDAERIAGLGAVPLSAQYLYPDTNDYFYRYGDGYLYRVDRQSSLVDALLPLLGGGYMPGSYLPNYYMSDPYYGMNSYFPAAYGFNNFYPDYGNDCYRYGNGVVYQVDCYSGYVENVIPMYAGGYGVGQIIPSDYSYYNVPMQYRSLYYPTADYSYWYAPGAIYQYDTSSSLITSVAALMSPGFSIGQPLPAGYGVYNVPYDYRTTYYDTPNAWYRYNNGYIYQVDPTTQLVTAIVASLLT